MSNPDPEKLVTMSRLMARLCLAALIIIPLGHLAIWFGLVDVRDVMGAAGVTALINAPETSTATRLGGFVLSMVPQLALLYGLMRLKHFFSGFAEGGMFGTSAAGHLRGFSLALLAYAALDFVMEAPLSAFATWNNPPGERLLTLGLGWDDLHIYFLIVLFFALTRVIAEGMRLARENAEFV
jgi:hypothetical protein